MSDGIQPIRYNPQMIHVKSKGATRDRKGKEGGQQEFSDHLTAKEDVERGRERDNKIVSQEKTEDHMEENDNSQQTDKDSDLDDTCGTIIDAEV